jgi:hypothetical protein
MLVPVTILMLGVIVALANRRVEANPAHGAGRVGATWTRDPRGLRHLSNTSDPGDPYASMYIVRLFHETPEQAWAQHVAWLTGKVLGPPASCPAYPEPADGLADGLVGVYLRPHLGRRLIRLLVGAGPV